MLDSARADGSREELRADQGTQQAARALRLLPMLLPAVTRRRRRVQVLQSLSSSLFYSIWHAG